MKALLIISGLFLIVHGEDPGYFYSPPSIIQPALPDSPTKNIDINKFVYFFKAPPTDKKSPKKPIINIPPPKKNYKIIFIQAPEPPAPAVPDLPLIPQNEEKTIVYVLNKKPEEQPTVFLPTPKPTKPSSPEVYFINYGLQKNNATPELSSEVSVTTPEVLPSEDSTPSSYPFKIPSQYLPPARQYGLQGTLDIPAEVSTKHLPPRTSYGVPIEAEAKEAASPPETVSGDSVAGTYLPPKTSYGEPIQAGASPNLDVETPRTELNGQDDSYRSQVRNSRSALEAGEFQPYLYFQRRSAVE